ncbi:uncharacterized protein FA14DRAFT_187068 [Meira miltonrushii]|uniref:Thioesterase domain-containing protein n=1 Tax=Meira miltonrushii TaxID=1280837 RepID=A0A316VKP1_9BASI|nr:uncharacterized protein FA14DRAFT_187068 [Meira miltonrushii]PWN36913.1 hypothetical protein FA14DRAFT_187068 [Meira miltonrushii]
MAKDQDRRSWRFPFHMDIQTRWLDNDQYGHLNNSTYYLITDTITNTYLIDHCGIQPYQHPNGQSQLAKESSPERIEPSEERKRPTSDSVIGLVISSSGDFYAPTSFPNLLRVGLRIVHLGNSSVTYEVGIFEVPATDPARCSSSLSSHADKYSLPKDALAAVITRKTHVFVDRQSRKPVKPMPLQLQHGLSKLKVDGITSKESNTSAKL